MTASNSEWSARTFGNEGLLPRVPLPILDDSCRRFLAWCAPLLDREELAETQAAVASFLHPDSPAHALQAALERYDAEPEAHSWLDRFWPSRYLGRRDRIALNANFFFLFKDSDEDQVPRAAGLIAAAVGYKLALDEERIPPVIQRGQATSMVQHKFLFSTTRIPGEHQDTIRAPYTKRRPGPSQAQHIVVFFRGSAFRMEVFGPDGRPHSLDDLEAGLHTVMKAGAEWARPEVSVGRLTTKARAEWAASRQRLLALDPANAEALDVIEDALFCVCLEDLVPQDDKHACDQMLHGNSGNRWFDKALSFIVFADGTAGINVEHCYLDGTTILTFVDTLLNEPARVHSKRSGAMSQGLPAVDPIELVLDQDMRADIRAAGEAFDDFAAATATSTLSLPGAGSDRIKQLGMSPDALVQMAFQVAHKGTKGLVGTTYESIATRQYQHGRTEAMRVVTPEVLQLVATLDDPDADRETRAAALKAAADQHVARVRACQKGEAPEQHLWELLLIQQRQGEKLGATEPMALYESPGWVKMRDDYLSTSSAPSVNIQYFGFGATSDRCIGIAYVLLPDRLKIYLSTPQAVADAMQRFEDELQKALDELQSLLSPDGD